MVRLVCRAPNVAITTYAELQTAVGNWLGRSDLTSRIPEFIALAEPKLRRTLRDKTTVAALTLTADTGSKALPATVKELLSIRYNTGTYFYPLTRKTPAMLAHLRRAGTGMPAYYSVVGGTVYFDVAPDSAYVMEIVYVEKITALASGVNSTLTDSPDIYLYAALCEAEPYLEHDERLPMWQQQLAACISDENTYRERSELAGGPTEIGLPTVFG